MKDDKHFVLIRASDEKDINKILKKRRFRNKYTTIILPKIIYDSFERWLIVQDRYYNTKLHDYGLITLELQNRYLLRQFLEYINAILGAMPDLINSWKIVMEKYYGK